MAGVILYVADIGAQRTRDQIFVQMDQLIADLFDGQRRITQRQQMTPHGVDRLHRLAIKFAGEEIVLHLTDPLIQ